MSTPARSSGILRRALLALVIAIGVMAGGFLFVSLPAGLSIQARFGLDTATGWSVLLVAALGLAAGALALVAGLSGVDRSVGQALGLAASAASAASAEDDGQADEAGIAALPQVLAEWRRRAEAGEAAQQRFETRVHELSALFRASRTEGTGSSPGTGAASPVARVLQVAADDSDEEALKELAAEVAALVEAGERRQQVLDALLAQVEDDLSAVEDPLKPGAEGLEEALSRLDELIQAWPSLTPLVSLRGSLAECLDRIQGSRRAAGLVDRELSAVRRRIGGARVARLTTEDFVTNGEEPAPLDRRPP